MNRIAATLPLVVLLAHAHAQANDAALKLNQIQVIGTHNSYHVGIAPNEAKLWQADPQYANAYKGLDYQHHRTGEDNADAHLKRTIMGHQVVIPITAGKLDLGPWEQIFYAEFDGRRKKRVVVKVMGM